MCVCEGEGELEREIIKERAINQDQKIYQERERIK